MLARLNLPFFAPAQRVRTPTVLQMEAVECGAAALAMILAYHGRIVSLEELRLACGVSRDGTKASNVIRAARGYGLTARGFSLEPEQLRDLDLPLIVFWNFNHFLVVEGFGRDKVYLNDPATGRRTVPQEEFDQSFTGVVLTFEPGPTFSRGGRRRSLIAALGQRLRGATAGLAFVVLASLALVVPGLVLPSLISAFIDTYLVRGVSESLVPILGAMGASALLMAALTWLQQAALIKLDGRLALSGAGRFFWHVLRLPIAFYTQRYGGEIGARVAINDSIAQLLSARLATTILSVVVIGFYAALMLSYDLVLTLISIGIVTLNLVTLRFVARRRSEGNQRLLQESGKLIGTTMNGLQMIESIKAGGAEADFFTRWSGYLAKVEQARQSLALPGLTLSVLPALLAALNGVAVLSLGALRVIDGQLTIGMLVAFQTLMIGFIGPVNTLVQLGGTLQEVEGNLNRLDDVLQAQTDPQLGPAPLAVGWPAPVGPGQPPTGDALRSQNDAQDLAAHPSGAGAAPPARLAGYLELRDVTFGYSRLDKPLIEHFNLSLRPGDHVALVGGSGSGKSTVARLVAGLFEPWGGSILFDGQPRSALPRALLQSSLALVDQEIFLFEGTVRQNLALWDTSIPTATIVGAARDAAIHSDIAARPDDYASPVEEGGRNFSGGQRQRLEIARALATDPAILILDEATSALDPISEHAIAEQLRRRGCTCLIVAHRLSTIRDCDEIIVLEQGRVAQRGTHHELIRVDGPYAQLIAAE